MNCKQGDLAIVVRSMANHEGKIVACVRRATVEELTEGNMICPTEPYWAIDRKLLTNKGDWREFVLDSNLRPLRDNDGEDEMLRIVGKPEVITQ